MVAELVFEGLKCRKRHRTDWTTALLLWLDLETTGLYPNRDHILEVAWTITDQNLMSHPADTIKNRIRDAVVTNHLKDVNPSVYRMHKESGLLADIDNPDVTKSYLSEIENEILADMRAASLPEPQWFLAGASVHFDLGFIRTRMPKLAAKLSHRVYDTSTLKAFFDSLKTDTGYREIRNEEPHRAAADVREVLTIARFLRDYANKALWEYELGDLSA